MVWRSKADKGDTFRFRGKNGTTFVSAYVGYVNSAKKCLDEMKKIAPEIQAYIDEQIRANKGIKYGELVKEVAERFAVHISKPLISSRAKALNVQVQRGRRRLIRRPEKPPAHSVFIDGAGAFFLKGAELEIGLLSAIQRLLAPTVDSRAAQRALKLAGQINALLLYAPVFELKTAQDIATYNGKGLLYLSGQIQLPSPQEIEQYLRFLREQQLLPLITKEVIKTCAEALFVRINFAGQTFYLDAQARTVWKDQKVPRHFSASINKASSYVKNTFQYPSPQHPLILQTAPGYTFLPKEMFTLIRCFEQAQKEPISRIAIANKSGETLTSWEDVQPDKKCYFLAPLSPWQYAQLQGTKIVKDFQQYQIGPQKEPMAVADAQINLFDSQANENIKVRAALIRRKEERIGLITNISRRQQRYIRRLVELYFCRWPQAKLNTYYDLLEKAHQETLVRSQSQIIPTRFFTSSYNKNPEEVFRLFLEHLHRYALSHFFPAEYEASPLKSMRERFYAQGGYLRIKQDCRQITLKPFAQKEVQKHVQIACARFNQSSVTFPDQRQLHLFC